MRASEASSHATRARASAVAAAARRRLKACLRRPIRTASTATATTTTSASTNNAFSHAAVACAPFCWIGLVVVVRWLGMVPAAPTVVGVCGVATAGGGTNPSGGIGVTPV
ncbi:MAG: hypothetical protein E6G57_02490 [Actinobacteria bacterium]|nr:MAG: hypothetical protein E6G57_02490 [Actinomycetota bacterium]